MGWYTTHHDPYPPQAPGLEALAAAQPSECNRHYALDRQCCRWLLRSLDRLPSYQLTMTEKLMANMLGVTVAQVTTPADELQAPGLLTRKGGQIGVVDWVSLEQKSCECYGIVKTETDRLLPPRGALLTAA